MTPGLSPQYLCRQEPLVCRYVSVSGIEQCGKEPIKFYKDLRRDVYIGFCKDHASKYPEGWAAFKSVPKEEAITHEVMGS